MGCVASKSKTMLSNIKEQQSSQLKSSSSGIVGIDYERTIGLDEKRQDTSSNPSEKKQRPKVNIRSEITNDMSAIIQTKIQVSKFQNKSIEQAQQNKQFSSAQTTRNPSEKASIRIKNTSFQQIVFEESNIKLKIKPKRSAQESHQISYKPQIEIQDLKDWSNIMFRSDGLKITQDLRQNQLNPTLRVS